jgi:tripartite ATP-independent transporter DctP family solute receptor
MRIDIYLNGQLGSEREMIEMLQVGSIAMTKVSAISLEGFSSGMRLFSIPYLFSDSDHYWRVLDSHIGNSMLNTLGDVRLKGVGYYDAGSRSFYMSDAPVNAPQDLLGKKVRVLPSRTSIKMVEALGGAATPITWGELYTALQQGVVDGAENNPPSYFLSKHYEAAKYYTLDEHTSVPDVLVMSSAVFDRLSEEQKGWLNRAVAESVDLQKKLWAEAETHALQQVKAAGVQVIYPDKKPFRAAVAGMRAAFLDSELGSIIKQVEALEASP